MLQLVEGHFLHELGFFDFLHQGLPGLFQCGEGRLFGRQGRLLQLLRKTRLPQRGPGFLHGPHRCGQKAGDLGNQSG